MIICSMSHSEMPAPSTPSTVPTPKPECLRDDDCPSTEACYDKKCQNPCRLRQPCGVNAECTAVDHGHSCTCLRGYVGNPWVQCFKGIRGHEMVWFIKGSIRILLTRSTILFTVPPSTVAPPPSTPKPECRKDSDCADEEACFNLKCSDPCAIRQPCGVNTECKTRNHIPICSCLVGYQGNPLVQCVKSTCLEFL